MMNDQEIKKVLANVKAPSVEENTRKRALNLAMVEFEAAGQKENKKNEKKFQGLFSLARLMGITTQDNRRNPMNKRYVYGGLATAMVVVLVAGVSLQQFTGEFSPEKVLDRQEAILHSAAVKDTDEKIAPVDPKDASSHEERIESQLVALNKEKIDTKEPSSEVGSKKNIPDTGTPLHKWKQIQEQRAGEHQIKTRLSDSKAIPAPKEEREKSAERQIKPSPSPSPEPAKRERLGEGKVTADRSRVTSEAIAIPMGAAGGVYPESLAKAHTMDFAGTHAKGYDDSVQQGYKDVGRDKFEDFKENPIKLVIEEPVSTFSIDVDTSSYSFMRRQINSGVLPQKDAVRIEEMINYFDYDYELPKDKAEPFKPSVTVVPSPWANGRKLVHIGIKGYDLEPAEKPHSNLVFLLDVSGSMNSPDKLPLLKNSFKLLLDTLEPDDTVGIVVYAGAAGTVLEPTKVSEKHKILRALEKLSAGGSTAGAEGIRQAYRLAQENFEEYGVNRIILATDGDFNVGITNRDELKDFVERKRKTGVFLSVLGFGQGNLNDHMMQTLAQNGNGVAAYIDTLSEARKVLVEEASSTLFPIAKDVKIQVEFNPKSVAEYRLIGYETRALNREDFNNDAVDAGDIGAGHTVTAIYEITPKGGPRTIDDSRYTKTTQQKADTNFSDEYAFLKMRYKNPDADVSKLITTPITTANEVASIEKANDDTRFATAVAAFGQILKGGKYTVSYNYDDVINLAQGARGDDPFGYRTEFVNLVRLAKSSAAMEKSAPISNPISPRPQPVPYINQGQ